MRESKNIRNVIAAHNRGYHIDEHGCIVAPSGKNRRATMGHNGFYRFSLSGGEKSKNGKRNQRTVYVHQLLAYQLFGDKVLDESLVVRHLSGDRLDNRPGNIKLATRSEVMMASAEAWRLAYGANAAQRMRRLSDTQVVELRARRIAGATLADLSREFGIAKSTASYIVNGRTYA